MGVFRMPSLGADMEDGTLVEWLKKPGDALKPGDIVAVVETQKGAIEIEVFAAGVLEKLLVEPGTTVPVGAPLAEISGAGDAPSPAPPAAVAPVVGRPVPPPVAVPAPVVRPASGAIAASPAARALAAANKVDLAGLSGSGPDGAILLADVQAAAQKTPPPKPVAKPATGLDPQAMRAAIAAAMSRSKREIPHYYLAHSMEIGTALDWLAQTNANRPPAQRLLPAALFIKALALALRKLPEFNGFHRGNGFEPSARIHVGVAIALRGGGLVAPAIHDTDTLPLDEVMARLRDLVARVRAGRFRGSELSDPTITLTSLGDRGVDLVMPVIYPPQVAIVGLGTPRPRPWVVDGAVVSRPVIEASMAGDHRVSDGHRGGLLLATWTDMLQQPEAL
jgi:pyruvate dehydrogenase E2 component (dihydrolipoamide acetyltransferase)